MPHSDSGRPPAWVRLATHQLDGRGPVGGIGHRQHRHRGTTFTEHPARRAMPGHAGLNPAKWDSHPIAIWIAPCSSPPRGFASISPDGGPKAREVRPGLGAKRSLS